VRRIALRPPISRVNSFGLKPSAAHSLVWNGVLTGKALKVAGLAGSAPPPLRTPPLASGPQLVGLWVKSLRSTSTSTERMLSRAPPKTSGIGSETARIWAV
jgi:hypothetical protein